MMKARSSNSSETTRWTPWDDNSEILPVTVPTFLAYCGIGAALRPFRRTPELYVDGPDEYPQATKRKMPDILPLGRLFLTKSKPWEGRITTPSEIDKAWQMLMSEVQRRWNLENPDNQITIVRHQKTTGQPQGSIYNLHGMRVRGLSDLRRGGMPLDILSKFVAGHSSLMMTLYYMEFEPSSINEMITKAAIASKAKEIDDFIRDLKKMDCEEARRRSVSIDPDALAAAVDSPSKIEFCNVDLGVCPYDGARCFDGGKLLRSDGKSGTYGNVGPRNCIMCRHFLSGPPWIPQLELFGSKLLAKRQHFAIKENEINEGAATLRERREAGQISREQQLAASGALQVDLLAIKEEQEQLETAIFNVETLINASAVLMARADKRKGKGKKGLALVGNDRTAVVEYTEVSPFVRALALGRVAEVYPVLGDDRVLAERDRRIDSIMHNAGETPLGLRIDITEKQRRRAIDMFAEWMLGSLCEAEIDALGNGTQRLQDLRVTSQIKSLIDLALADSVPVITGHSLASAPALQFDGGK